MIYTKAKKRKMLQKLGKAFLETGGFANSKEYSKSGNTPVRVEQIRQAFGNWGRMQSALNKYSPDVYKEILLAEEAVKAPKPKATPKPKAAAKPAAKPAVTKGKQL